MGVGGNFWDLLKPYARYEGFEFLRNKRVAVDLSYWVVQHETAIKGYTRNPHIRITFFRTVNLFSKVQVFFLFMGTTLRCLHLFFFVNDFLVLSCLFKSLFVLFFGFLWNICLLESLTQVGISLREGKKYFFFGGCLIFLSFFFR